jgi:Rrf2 family protein
MLISRACGYAIQALVYLAKQPEGQLTPNRKISEELGIPHHFLGKIVQNLVKAGILKSRRGPKGGLTLARKPGDITLMDIAGAVDGRDFTTMCIIGLPSCDDETPCPLHIRWNKVRKELLAEETIASLLEEN